MAPSGLHMKMAQNVCTVEKKKGLTSDKGKENHTKETMFTYSAACLAFRQGIHLLEDQGHAVPMVLAMD